MKKGLIIFAREPVPGKVKTRLARDIGDVAAADLYAAMLNDTINNACSLKNITILIFWALENESLPVLSSTVPLEMFRQNGNNLGERMTNAFETAFSKGISACCIIGSDSPDLPPELIMQAFDHLAYSETDVVYGPAEDGGYYLLGMKQLWQRLFEGISWSSPSVISSTLDRIDELKLHGAPLPTWYDIDTLPELQRLTENTEPSAPLTRTAFQRVFPGIEITGNTGAP